MASPVVETTATDATTAAGTAHTINLPASIAAGNLLLVKFAYNSPSGSETISATGWTNITGFVTRNGTDQAIHALYRQADGAEGATVEITSSTSTKASTISYRISGAEDPATQAPEAGTGVEGLSGPDTANPPSVSGTGGSKDYLFIASMAIEGETFTGRAAPTNYTNLLSANTGTGGTIATNSMIQSAQRALTAASDDPGVFGHTANEDWVAQTVVIHPAGAGAVTGTLGVTQAAQTSAASGQLGYSGTLGVTQAAQTSAATGQLGYTGTLGVTQADQTSAASGTVVNFQGTLAVTQADQTSAASGTATDPPITGSSAVTQEDQTSTASGTHTAPPTTGTLAVTQEDQVSAASGQLGYSGTSATVQADQTSSASGTVTQPVTGTMAVTQADQVATASGTYTPSPVTGTFAVTQENQTSTATGAASGQVFTFAPPATLTENWTKIHPTRTNARLYKQYQKDVHPSVLIEGGVVREKLTPTMDEINAADVGSGYANRAAFMGGRTWQVTAAEKTILEAAGYVVAG